MSPKEVRPGLYQVKNRLYRVTKVENDHVFWEYENGKPRGGKLGGRIKVAAFSQRAVPYVAPQPAGIPKVIPVVKDPEDVIISSYDMRLLKILADEASEQLISYGTSADSIKKACVRAFRLGFTACLRGEAVQEHPAT